MNNLILVRHGQSKYNLERRFTGFYDVGLTQKGKDEAAYAGKLIKNLNIEFDSYFTSMLSRAYDSLNIILKVLDKPNVEINKAWELNERHYGGLTGLNKDETIKKYGDKQVKIWRRSFNILLQKWRWITLIKIKLILLFQVNRSKTLLIVLYLSLIKKLSQL